jgi:YlmC/YmxH family sporulation protein
MHDIDLTFCELREREVVNVTDGKKLGRLCDIALNCKGQTLGIIVPGDRRFIKNITCSENIFIPWHCILKIGDDVILVDLNNNPPPKCGCPSV